MAKARVLIIGGGIGGLSAAIALRDRGFEVVVAELRSASTDVDDLRAEYLEVALRRVG